MAETEAKRMTGFKYEPPASLDRPKRTVQITNTALLRVGVQVVRKDGGETNMHAHPSLDSTWMVLAGQARFYGYGDVVIAEPAKHEGVNIPRGVPYWFEAISDEPLEILHITATDPTATNERVNYAERTAERQKDRPSGRLASDEERQAATRA
ncbi:MAG: cupin domain-containing protein [Chloroflexi bacterium]|nr:cupin domain-containing protein [Chloroflexota bacterium]MCH7655171.1 cupin domain-containing protein [Chloroflexota bacterium]